MSLLNSATKAAVLCIAMGLFFAQAAAETAAELKETIESYGGGGLEAAVSGNTVTVTGTKTDATTRLALDIDDDVTVVWKAELSGDTDDDCLVAKRGMGILEVQSGKIEQTSTSDAVAIYFDEGNLIISGGTVSVLGGYVAIYNDGRDTVSISGGIVQATADGYAVLNANPGAVIINGGTVQATGENGIAVVNYDFGTVSISGGTVQAAADGIAIWNDSYAYSDDVDLGKVTLDGSPDITGLIAIRAGNFGVADGFVPGEKIYTLYLHNLDDLTWAAVANGAAYLSNFALANTDYVLSARGGNIVFAATDGYAVEKSGTTYTITKGTGEFISIQDAIEYIKEQSGGAALTIQFGNGTDVLDIGESSIKFDGGTDGSDWGLITLAGKLTSEGNFADIIRLDNGVSINSKAELETTGYFSSVILNESTGSITISGGTISAEFSRAIDNAYTGTVIISGGTIVSSLPIGNRGIVFVYDINSDVIDHISNGYDGTGVVLAWDKNAGTTTYTAGTSVDIFKLPETATAVWASKDGKAGISYANGENTGFIEVAGITVKAATPIRNPQIAAGNLKVKATASSIILENLPSNAKVEVYNLQGKQVYSTTSHSPLATSHLEIGVQTKGMYIVKTGNESVRVVVR